MNVMSLETVLNELHLQVDCAFNGRVAIKNIKKRLKLKQPLYQLILLDFAMPEMDGPTTAIKIRDLLFKDLPATSR